MYNISLLFFFFNDTATTEIYTLSLHDALPICCGVTAMPWKGPGKRYYYQAERQRGRIVYTYYGAGEIAALVAAYDEIEQQRRDRKSTRLNSSHANISYAVFCLKKKK